MTPREKVVLVLMTMALALALTIVMKFIDTLGDML